MDSKVVLKINISVWVNNWNIIIRCSSVEISLHTRKPSACKQSGNFATASLPNQAEVADDDEIIE